MTKELDAAPGDIRSLKYRIHELEGEVIGYKRIFAEHDEAIAAARVAENERCARTLEVIGCQGYADAIRALIGKESK